VKQFLRENWVWFVAPLIVAAIVLGLLLAFGGGEGASPFIYTI